MLAFTKSKQHEQAKAAALLLALLSFAIAIYCTTSLMKQFSAPGLLKNPHFIALIVAAAAFIASLIAVGIISHFNNSYIKKEKEKPENRFAQYYGHAHNMSTVVLAASAAVSLVMSSALFGSILQGAENGIIGALASTTNPLCIGLFVSLAILACSIMALAIKSVIAQDTQYNYIFIHSDKPLTEKGIEKVCDSFVEEPYIIQFISVNHQSQQAQAGHQ
ncbi:hypothetical protein EDL79_04575 [Ehrlichia ruminantium]|uniref:Uncharacterized protein n=1 Tax=Ehrlichia ruminantium TaxID=779 RepID=A0AAE6Q9G8_EHRRU|nr:hypothetical protein [Ehrlichia ruminantium]QGR02880.1 hypothetical protein EDL81_04560 [Ehrlichia ruminantium]QGR03804.1 hypothetical protein EDL80_04565 [Ehrlichia ruminantium]QGR04731.1 hypothetical protein EDL79_04575 [Ehrlichia ruminantium]